MKITQRRLILRNDERRRSSRRNFTSCSQLFAGRLQQNDGREHQGFQKEVVYFVHIHAAKHYREYFMEYLAADTRDLSTCARLGQDKRVDHRRFTSGRLDHQHSPFRLALRHER